MSNPQKITGLWRGVYAYGAVESSSPLEPVPFQLDLKQRWFGRFTGSVTDDEVLGMPGVGTVLGCLKFPAITFIKQMPVCYIRAADGKRTTLRAYLIERGHSYEQEIIHQPILYRGEFSDAGHAEGTWLLPAGPKRLPDGLILQMPGGSGKWTMEKFSSGG